MVRLQGAFILAFSLLIVIDITQGGIFCSNKKRKSPHYGTFTFYSDADTGSLPPPGKSAPDGCQPIYINMLVRHGAMYPPSRDYHIFDELYNLTRELNSTGKATLCSRDMQTLRDWKLWMSPYDSQNQTAYGDKEVEQIALTYRRGFPEILSCSHNPDRYSFISTSTPRTAQSMHRFAEKLLCARKGKLPADAKLSVTPWSRDPIVWVNCPKFHNSIKTNQSSRIQYNLFLKGPQFRRVGNRISTRLGIPREKVTPQLLVNIHKGCFYEHWITPKYAPWCNVFSSNDLEILEYSMDLSNFDERSYTFPVSYEKNCFHSKEIVNSIKLASEYDQKGKRYELGKFRFPHITNILSLATHFRLIKADNPPTARNFNRQRNRMFKVTHLIPSATNLAFILYRCGNVTNTCYDVNDYMVKIYLNEKPLSIPACAPAKSDDENDKEKNSSDTFCSLGKFLDYYEKFVAGSENECDQAEICEEKM